ncbi:MAG: protein kinase, partial [Planctomycetes bacterium]|nr:protein kinase [Planctomycetota bacterium]
ELTSPERPAVTAGDAAGHDGQRPPGEADGATHAAPEIDPLDAKVGDILGDGAVVKNRLGKGSTAKALLVDRGDGANPREVVYKVSLGGDADARLRDEAAVLAGLRHPAVVERLDLVELAGRPVLVEAVAGRESLADELRRNGTPGIEFLERWGSDLLGAVAHLQREGRSHRDIKPDNLGVRADGVVKLGDLGLATSSAELNGEEQGVFGTPHYIAPEQAQGKAIDHRADIYALGATWYRLLSGQTLFSGSNVREILRNQVRTPHQSLLELMPDVPAALSKIIDQMLAKDPIDRYQSADEIIHDIDLWQANRNLASDAMVGSRSSRAGVVLAGASGKPKPIVIAVLILVVLGLAGLAYVLFGGDPKPEPNPSETGKGASAPPTRTLVQDPPEATEEYEAILGIIGNPNRFDEAMQRLRSLVELYPDAPVAKRANDKAKSLEAERAEAKLRLDEASQTWDQLKKTARERALDSFQMVPHQEALEDFVTSLAASNHPEIVGFANSLEVKPLCDSVKTEVDAKFRASIVQATQSPKAYPEASRASQYENSIKALEALVSKPDDAVLIDEAKSALERLKEEFRTFESTMAEKSQRERVAAAKASFQRFSATLKSLVGKVQALQFESANAELDRLLNEDKGFKDYKDSEEYAELMLLVEDRRAQTLEAKDSLSWLLSHWRTHESEAALVVDDKSPLAPLMEQGQKAFRLRESRKSEAFVLFFNSGPLTGEYDLKKAGTQA